VWKRGAHGICMRRSHLWFLVDEMNSPRMIGRIDTPSRQIFANRDSD
jgi:hypothetical protein